MRQKGISNKNQSFVKVMEKGRKFPMYVTGLEEVPPKATLPEGIHNCVVEREDKLDGHSNEVPEIVQTRRNPL